MSLHTYAVETYRSTWAFAGSYALVAPTLFTKENYDGFFLEYDDDRSGDFDPLKYIPKGEGGPKVIHGTCYFENGRIGRQRINQKADSRSITICAS